MYLYLRPLDIPVYVLLKGIYQFVFFVQTSCHTCHSEQMVFYTHIYTHTLTNICMYIYVNVCVCVNFRV